MVFVDCNIKNLLRIRDHGSGRTGLCGEISFDYFQGLYGNVHNKTLDRIPCKRQSAKELGHDLLGHTAARKRLCILTLEAQERHRRCLLC